MSSVRSARLLLWAAALAGVVAWAGCGGNVSTPGSSTDSASSSGTTSPCVGSPTACFFYAYPNPGMICPEPGACCYTDICNDGPGSPGGLISTEFVCNDAGTWVSQ